MLDKGLVPYAEAREMQRMYVQQRQQDQIPDTLLVLEHAPTVTYGRGADRTNLLLTPEGYAERGIALRETDRGGDVTYHGPGQLIGYPILHLGEGCRDLHHYVQRLEAVLIAASGDLGVAGADRAPWHAGVWVGDGYLAALGVRVARWVTHHGFALNVDNRIQAGFATIVPCGVVGKRIVTVEELAGHPVSLPEAARCVEARFKEVFAAGLDKETHAVYNRPH